LKTASRLSPDAVRPKPSAKARVAVIDIGSNSIRLVVFDGLKRTFFPIFNEKVICGLGRGMEASGRLSEEGVEMALVNLPRFVRMAHGMGVEEVHMLATAAVREAANGAAFIAQVERRCDHGIVVLSGAEEARISALGVLAGMPTASGVMGDLGGGSLELVELVDGELGASATLPLGALRLIGLSDGGLRAARREIDRQLAELGWLEGSLRDRDFYAVGGAWRNLARLHMGQSGYPLYVIQDYAMRRDDAEQLVRLVGGLGRHTLARIPGVPRRRLEVLPYAALLLGRIMKLGQPKRVVLSSYGLREGFLFERLPEAERAKDPLLAAAKDFARREGRFGNLGSQLAGWIEPLFADEDANWRRLRLAACHLSDFAWREHPDYRAGQALFRVLHYPFSGLDHPGRAFIGYAVFSRYGGGPQAKEAATARALLSPSAAHGARLAGLALRLAYTLSGGTSTLLRSTRLVVERDRLHLMLPSDGSVPSGEAVERRFAALAEAAGVGDRRIIDA
jgi:exopolyphosphatase/guanosine-5'-triphosphate,3'-diphosphate pyrophosphatase